MYFQVPNPGKGRTQMNPAWVPSIGHDHSDKFEIPGMVFTLLFVLFLRFGWRLAVDVPIIFFIAFSISCPSITSNPARTYRLIEWAICINNSISNWNNRYKNQSKLNLLVHGGNL